MEEQNIDYYVWGGDFNKNLSYMDKKGKFTMSKSAELINLFMEEGNWSDVWRALHGEEFRFTYHRSKQKIFSRLDYFVIPTGQLDLVKECEIWPGYLSDHSFVYLEEFSLKQS